MYTIDHSEKVFLDLRNVLQYPTVKLLGNSSYIEVNLIVKIKMLRTLTFFGEQYMTAKGTLSRGWEPLVWEIANENAFAGKIPQFEEIKN